MLKKFHCLPSPNSGILLRCSWLKAKEMAMDPREFDENEMEVEDFNVDTTLSTETTTSTKLERRRRIEDLFEEKRLREELAEFG